MKLKKIRSKIIRLIGRITGCYNWGKNNKVIVIKNGKPHERIFMPKGLNVIFDGSNCTVTIEKPISFQNTFINLEGNNAEVKLAQTSSKISNVKIYADYDCKITVGKGVYFSDTNVVLIANAAYDKPISIEIGENVAIARDVLIRTSDGHTIINPETKEPLNPSESIKIEDNVWIGSKCVILKGVHISKGSIVGACSLVNKKFDEENVIIAGTPAKIIKHNVTWHHNGYGFYKKHYFDPMIKDQNC